MKTAITLIILFNVLVFIFMYRLRSLKCNSLAPSQAQSERLNEATKTLAEQFCVPLVKLTKKLLERLRTTTKTERLLFACCVYYGGVLLIFKILGI